ncbi:Methyltransferase-like protein 16 [Homalodisca vitripennis]|nr:Methyltransferase-like protein 16 [Homalodisca vitripennis]
MTILELHKDQRVHFVELLLNLWFMPPGKEEPFLSGHARWVSPLCHSLGCWETLCGNGVDIWLSEAFSSLQTQMDNRFKLSLCYSEISGKVSIDFKNKESLRALTSTLLKEDFGLDVEIPLNRLIPTLPLRLNYLLWIEDILAANRKTSDIIRGIDIGCGASCVYPLLAAKHFQWQMLGTEVDEESVLIASNNVTRNGLSDRITIQKTPERTMLDGVLEADTVYDFCVCNPPFFSSEEELEPQNVARSPSRPPPRNAMTGASWELVTPGGEVAFVESIIQDSLKLKDKVRYASLDYSEHITIEYLVLTVQNKGSFRTAHMV